MKKMIMLLIILIYSAYLQINKTSPRGGGRNLEGGDAALA
jgi:hypothetical protein